MAPTRENSAQQIDRTRLQGFGLFYVPVSGMAIYGCTDLGIHTIKAWRKSLKWGADVVIATFGQTAGNNLNMGYVDLV